MMDLIVSKRDRHGERPPSRPGGRGRSPASERGETSSPRELGGDSDSELDLFLRAVGDAEPLRDRDRIPPPRPERSPRPAKRPASKRAPLALEREGEHAWARTRGVSDRQLASLRRGELEPEDEIDLHGMTADEAAQRAESFVAASAGAGCRCVLIISGRGRGAGGFSAVKEAVLDALSEGRASPHIRALSTAAPRHGGPGALYVALKRRSAVET